MKKILFGFLLLLLSSSIVTVSNVNAQTFHAFLSKDERPKTVSSVAAQTTVTTEQGTIFSDLVGYQLPATVNCTMSDGKVYPIKVTWAQGTYDNTTPATYTLTGTLTSLPSFITNPSALTASINVTVYWSPLADQVKNILWLNPSNKFTLQQESNSNTPATAINQQGDRVGWLMDRGLAARDALATSDTRRPWYYVDSDGFPMLEFQGAQQLVVQNTTKLLNTLHVASPSFSLVIYVKRKTNGTASVWFATDSGSSSNAGIYLGITASNTIQFILTKTGGTMVNATTTATLTVASGRQPIFVTVNGTGAGACSIQIGSGTAQTFTVTAGAASDAFANFTYGSRNDSQSFTSDYLSDLVIRNGTFSGTDLTNYQNYLPQDKGFYFAPVVQNWYDHTDANNNFSDAGGTTPCNNGDAIRYVKNKATAPTGAGPLNTDATSTSGNSPTFQTNSLNSLAASKYDGSGVKLTLQSATNKGGIYTVIVVYRNDNTTVGSTALNGHAIIAENQTTDAEFGSCLRVTTGAGATIVESNCPNKNNTANVSVIERLSNGIINVYNGYKDKITVTDLTDGLSYSTIGNGVNSTIHMNGIISEILIYKGKFANVNSVIDTYNSKYAITPTAGNTPSSYDIPFYVIMGQSNVESAAPFQNTGHNAYSTLPSALQATQSKINLYNNSGFSANFTHNSSCTWGWADQFWYTESARLNKTIFCLKFGRPSTTLGTANPFPQTTALNYLSDAYSKLLTTYGSSRIHPIVIWDQGVSDAANSTDANNYQTNLTNWFVSLRQILGQNTYIIYFRLGNWSTQPFTTTVQGAQDNLQSWQNLLLNTDAINHTPDNQHYDETPGGAQALGNNASTTATKIIK